MSDSTLLTAQELEKRRISRTLAMHRLVVEKIKRDPELFEKARTILARWRTTVCKSSQPYLAEWEALMNEGVEACLTFALEESEHASDMRKSSPLTVLLSNDERHAIFREWAQK